jgi:solute carrier family 25, member 44
MASERADIGNVNWNDIYTSRLLFLTGVASSLEIAMTYPAWVIKTRQQVLLGRSSTSLSQELGRFYKSGSSKFKEMTRFLFRGYGTYVSLALPSYMFYTTAYTWSKSELGYESGYRSSDSFNVKSLVPVAAGLFADVFCLVTYVPVELVTQKLQVASENAKLKNIVGEILRKDGLVGFYKGFGATVITSGISSSIVWVTYENAKKVLQKSLISQDSSNNFLKSSVASMMAGSLAFAASNIIVNPLDIVKTRMQVSEHAKGDMRAFKDGIVKLFAEEGVKGAFSRGIGPKICSAIPLGALSSITYELILYLSRKDK